MKRKINLFFHIIVYRFNEIFATGIGINMTYEHALIATRTGAITGLLVVLMSFIPWKFYLKLPMINR